MKDPQGATGLSKTNRQAPFHRPMPKPTVTPQSSQADSPRKPPARRAKYRFGLRTLRYYYHRLVRLRSSTGEIARGFAIGCFCGCLPLFGLQVILSLAVATLFKGQRFVAAATTWISNPFTYIPLYAFGFHVGRSLLGYQNLTFPKEAIGSITLLSELGGDFLRALFFGCIVVGSVLGVCGYWGSFYLVQRARQRKRRRRRSRSSS